MRAIASDGRCGRGTSGALALALTLSCALWMVSGCERRAASSHASADATNAARSPQSQTPQSQSPQQQQRLRASWGTAEPFTLDLLDARAQRSLPAPLEVTLADPIYQATKRYRGHRLEDIVRTAPVPPASGQADEWDVIFDCADGYRVKVPLSVALAGKGVLAFADDQPLGWQPVRKGRMWTTPDPYYLVWTDGDHERPWPYAVVRLIVSRRSTSNSAGQTGAGQPATDKTAADVGRGLFERWCQRCHSINLEGGTLGPELNVPRNVTEYWREDLLPAFIRDASSFRAGTKMPRFDQLSEADVAALIDYLKRMRTQKRLPPASAPAPTPAPTPAAR